MVEVCKIYSYVWNVEDTSTFLRSGGTPRCREPLGRGVLVAHHPCMEEVALMEAQIRSNFWLLADRLTHSGWVRQWCRHATWLSAACIIAYHGPKCKMLPNPLNYADQVSPFASHILCQDDGSQVRGYDRQSFLIACSMRAKHGQDASGHSFTPSFGRTWSHRRCRHFDPNTSKTVTCCTLDINTMSTCTISIS